MESLDVQDLPAHQDNPDQQELTEALERKEVEEIPDQEALPVSVDHQDLPV